ncbi:hypothetical protein D3C72_1799230 [compost metagenome]
MSALSPLSRSARRVACSTGADGLQATARSRASIAADTFASISVTPLPWLMTIDFAFGETAFQTGMPMLSSPVRRASLLMPKAGKKGTMRAKVSSGAQMRSEQ